MYVSVRMQVAVTDEKIENDDGDVGLEVSARQLRHHFLNRPKEKTLRLAVRVHGNEIQRQRKVETKLPVQEAKISTKNPINRSRLFPKSTVSVISQNTVPDIYQNLHLSLTFPV